MATSQPPRTAAGHGAPPTEAEPLSRLGVVSPSATRARLLRILRRTTWFWVLVVGAAAYLLELSELRTTSNPNLFPSLLLLGSAVVPLSVMLFAAQGGEALIVPGGWLLALASVGGVVGTLAAASLEYAVGPALPGAGILSNRPVVSMIEETSKLIVPGVVLLALARRHPHVGVVVGVASGMGFAALETMGYGFTALLRDGSLSSVDGTLQLRALLSPTGHVAWTGVTVAALWRIPTARHRRRAVALSLLAFTAAVALHTAWNSDDSITAHVLVGAASTLGLLATIHGVHRVVAREARGTPSHLRPDDEERPKDAEEPPVVLRSVADRGRADGTGPQAGPGSG
ncbi:PrsW family intramembrane metalloprotease [Pedococcus sp. KACC 23699]|uniref:PrsW family intramembrane metalloprotease n=1 Tax=Pedococcus sp. KACC 23699 TaxID=3149228 RepID=A0AAU7JU14_9MICO